jgi:fibronectin type 3 domain-containing protein
VHLFWSGVDAPDLRRYDVYRDTAPIDSTAGPGSYVPFDSVAVGDTSLTDFTVQAGETYYYRVAAVDSVQNESGFSSSATVSPSLTITGFQPESGAPGTTVRIRGTGFSSTVSNNTVTMGGVSATIDSAKSSVLYAQVSRGRPRSRSQCMAPAWSPVSSLRW